MKNDFCRKLEGSAMGENGATEVHAEKGKHSYGLRNRTTDCGDYGTVILLTVPGSWAALGDNRDVGTRATV